jgi:ketosteroid isomerase-like protein
VSQSTGSEKEIIELHQAWFAAAAAKDLDASMAPISPEIVSYEHTAPLQFTEIDAIREECRAGFDRAAEDFTWTVPDLRVVVRDDLAVAWGLNRMADHHPDGTEDVTWSRGTRVFQRSGGRWRMVHQHVSFPVDPATGQAATDLAP